MWGSIGLFLAGWIVGVVVTFGVVLMVGIAKEPDRTLNSVNPEGDAYEMGKQEGIRIERERERAKRQAAGRKASATRKAKAGTDGV